MKALFSVVSAIAMAVFIISIPLAIIATDVTVFAFDPSFYEQGQIKYGAMQTIGLTPIQVHESSVALANFIADQGSDLASELQQQGLPAAFFSARETIHLGDVRAIIARIETVQILALAYMGLYGVALLLIRRNLGLWPLAKGLFGGAGLTLVALLVFGILSVTDFSNLFLTFHLVSFNNDLWILDPRTDYLIRMFPSDFFLEASLVLARTAALQSMGLIIIGAVLVGVDRLARPRRA